MQFDWISSAIGFLLGTLTGAAGKYYAEKFTDQRRKTESTRQLKQEFLNIKRQMPELIKEFKDDLSKANQKFIREFFVLENHKVVLGGSGKPRFSYYEEEHPNLRGKVDILENQGFLIDVTPSNVPVYRMTEEFVHLVNRYG